MNHNEPGFLQATIEGRRRSEIPGRAFVRQKGKQPFPKASSDAYVGKKIREQSHHWHPVRSALSNSIADQPTR
jgi:hypothetical protein